MFERENSCIPIKFSQLTAIKSMTILVENKGLIDCYWQILYPVTGKRKDIIHFLQRLNYCCETSRIIERLALMRELTDLV